MSKIPPDLPPIREIDRLLRRRTLRLSFPPIFERMFQARPMHHYRSTAILSYIVAIATFEFSLIADWALTGLDLPVFLVGRLLVALPLALIGLAMVAWSPRLLSFAVGALPCVLSAVNGLTIAWSNGGYSHYYLYGDLIIMICCCFLRPSMKAAILSMAVQCGIFLWTLFACFPYQHDFAVVGCFFLGFGSLFGLLATYIQERFDRRDFLLRARVRVVQAELETASVTDPLTGLGNRRALEQHVVDRWRRDRSQPVAVILLDVDEFKAYNDAFGHGAGDACLATIARCLVASLPTSEDVAIRFGGEEMLVFLPRADVDGAERHAEQIRTSIEAANIPHSAAARTMVVTASLGVASALARQTTIEELVRRADAALYLAKTQGRNRVVAHREMPSLPESAPTAFSRPPGLLEPT